MKKRKVAKYDFADRRCWDTFMEFMKHEDVEYDDEHVQVQGSHKTVHDMYCAVLS